MRQGEWDCLEHTWVPIYPFFGSILPLMDSSVLYTVLVCIRKAVVKAPLLTTFCMCCMKVLLAIEVFITLDVLSPSGTTLMFLSSIDLYDQIGNYLNIDSVFWGSANCVLYLKSAGSDPDYY